MKKLFTIFLFVLLLSMTVNAAANMEITFWTHEDPNRTEIETAVQVKFKNLFSLLLLLIRDRISSICLLKMNMLT